MALLRVTVTCMLVLQGVLAAEWSYSGPHGPEFWSETYSACGLDGQSPINIYEGDVRVDESISPFTYQNYDTATDLTMSIKNNGHTAVVSLGGNTAVQVSGGGLPGTFRAVQFHFHWGESSDIGSEHLISSHAYPLELHIVHYNTKYSNIGQAISQSDGLAVLGFMYEVSNSDNADYVSIISGLGAIRALDATTQITPVALNSLLPQTFQNFYRYDGSLTTPQCQESVTWTVFKEPIKISEAQLEAFRRLLDSGSNPLVDNFRPVQPLNARVVTSNFNPNIHWGYADGHADHWDDYYSICGAESQSPINIPAATSQLDSSIPAFTFTNYDSTQGITMSLKNNGHAAQVDIGSKTITVSGGGLPETYVAAQFHFHWGSTNMQGSEHTLNGKAYPMELHIVHYKQSLGSLGAAATRPEGLAVLGFFFEISDGDNEAFRGIVENLPSIRNPDPNGRRTIPTVTMDSLLPAEKDAFFRYSGSLTTPGCFESVIWTVFNDPIRISLNQLNEFRRLMSSEHMQNGTARPLVNNFRPVQNLNSRIVRRNFEYSAPKPHWTYEGEHGVDHWYKDFPACQDTPSSRQSPIDIQSLKSRYEELPAFSLARYNAVDGITMELENNGHSVQCNIVNGNIQVSGGGLSGAYRAAQFHFHWGSDNNRGSEHLINSEAYPMEIHIVHYNIIYPDLGTAATQPNGLAVLGFMVEISPVANANLEPLIQKLSEIREPKSKTTLQTMKLENLISDVRDFYRYQGSLTTPGCYESVTWTVFRTPIKMSEEQLQKFRSVKSSEINPATNQYNLLVDNYRPPQPINNRVVRANFYIDPNSGYAVKASVAFVLLSQLLLVFRQLL